MVLLSGSLSGQGASSSRDQLISGALSWYSVWMGDSSAASDQNCDGIRRGGYLLFVCKPLDVLVGAVLHDFGQCSIRVMKRALPDASTYIPFSLDEPREKPFECGEIKNPGNTFSVTIAMNQREPDKYFSEQAKQKTITYIQSVRDRACDIYFPLVAASDPFLHVYEVCGGIVEGVMEVPIELGRPAEGAVWLYSRHRRNLPPYADERAKRTDLWYSVLKASAPEK